MIHVSTTVVYCSNDFFVAFSLSVWKNSMFKDWKVKTIMTESSFLDNNTKPTTIESELLYWNQTNKHQQCMRIELLFYMASPESIASQKTDTFFQSSWEEMCSDCFAPSPEPNEKIKHCFTFPHVICVCPNLCSSFIPVVCFMYCTRGRLSLINMFYCLTLINCVVEE